MKVFGIIVNVVLIAAIAVIAGLSLATMLPIPGKIEMKIVQSGSMEPTIHTGSVVVIRPEPSYGVGDIVTFGADTKAHVPTTHRIFSSREESGVTYFSTKGDANEDVDAEETTESAVIGRVLFSAPYIGYLIDFARKPLGFILLIVVPAALIIIHELWGIVDELRGKKKKRPTRPVQTQQREEVMPSGRYERVLHGREERVLYTRDSVMEDIYQRRVVTAMPAPRRNPMFFVALIAAFAAGGAGVAGTTLASYGDIEKSVANLLSAANLDFGVDADAPRSISLTLEGAGEGNAVGFEPFVVELNGSLPFAYMVEAEITGGDSAFCDALQLKGTAPLFDYDGPLHDLSTATTSDSSPWSVQLYVPEGTVIADGTLCMADLIYKGAQEGADIGDEYHDEERLPLIITYHVVAPFNALGAPPEGDVLGETTVEPPSDPVPPIDTPVEPPVNGEPPADLPPADVPAESVP